jgi:hypothetical protein
MADGNYQVLKTASFDADQKICRLNSLLVCEVLL